MKRYGNWAKLRKEIIEKKGKICNRCYYFHNPKENDSTGCYSDLIVDHIIPLKLGGEELNEDNLQVLCKKCNKEKNRWDQHFIAKYKREVRRDGTKTN